MISVSGKNWEENFLNKRIVEKVKLDHDFSDIISKLIISRNFDQLEINTINKKINFQNVLLLIAFVISFSTTGIVFALLSLSLYIVYNIKFKLFY